MTIKLTPEQADDLEARLGCFSGEAAKRLHEAANASRALRKWLFGNEAELDMGPDARLLLMGGANWLERFGRALKEARK